jgi:hypothetical protein
MDRLGQLQEQLGDGRIAPPPLDQLESSCEFLWTLLTQDTWKDGSKRELSTVVIDRVPGGYRVTLQDHALWVQKRALALTWAEIPNAIEKALCDTNVPWEPYRSFRTKAGPKVSDGKKGGRRKKG